MDLLGYYPAVFSIFVESSPKIASRLCELLHEAYKRYLDDETEEKKVEINEIAMLL